MSRLRLAEPKKSASDLEPWWDLGPQTPRLRKKSTRYHSARSRGGEIAVGFSAYQMRKDINVCQPSLRVRQRENIAQVCSGTVELRRERS